MDTGNSERYDRQIRLWGEHGQSKCSSAKICLINANALGTEVLKNLCLAGIHSFEIIDSNKISGADVGNNFFVTYDKVGTKRAACARDLLMELNENVPGGATNDPIDPFLPPPQQASPQEVFEEVGLVSNYWSQFTCVVACGQFSESQLVRLSQVCWFNDIPLVLCRTIGFIGYIRVQVREHYIIEAHPDNSLPDFRLDCPFNSLKAHMDLIKFDLSDIARMNEYPYVVILYKYLIEWRSKFGHSAEHMPSNYEEKRQIKQLIMDAMEQIKSSTNDDRNIELENFLEASKVVNSVMTPSRPITSHLMQLFDHPRVTGDHTGRFLKIIKAVKDYVFKHNDGRLPVSGSIPDMASSSSEYIKLQQVYRSKAKEDTDAVFNHCQEPINMAGGSPGRVSYDDVRLVCQNIRDIQIIHTPPIYSEYLIESSDIHGETCWDAYIARETEKSYDNDSVDRYMAGRSSSRDLNKFPIRWANVTIDTGDDDESIAYYLAFRAVDKFYSTYGRSPGYLTEQVEADMPKLRQCYKDLGIKLATVPKSIDQYLYELCRYGGAELHTIASFVAGCVSQEVIKLVTNQYGPLAGVMLYNGMSSTTKTFSF